MIGDSAVGAAHWLKLRTESEPGTTAALPPSLPPCTFGAAVIFSRYPSSSTLFTGQSLIRWAWFQI